MTTLVPASMTEEALTAAAITASLAAKAADSAVVHNTGNETIAGIKTFSSQPVLPQALTVGTAQNTTSGTAIDFTGIPSWAKRVTVMLAGVSTNGASSLIVRLGSGSIQATGYDATASTGGTGGQSSTTGFLLSYSASAATAVQKGMITFVNMGGNLWVGSGVFSDSVYQLVAAACSGTVTLSGALDRLRLTTVNGTDVFDAGSVNILYE